MSQVTKNLPVPLGRERANWFWKAVWTPTMEMEAHARLSLWPLVQGDVAAAVAAEAADGWQPAVALSPMCLIMAHKVNRRPLHNCLGYIICFLLIWTIVVPLILAWDMRKGGVVFFAVEAIVPLVRAA
jgi:hypothetical protein